MSGARILGLTQSVKIFDMKSEGLRRVPCEHLQRLLRLIHHDKLLFPLTRSGLITAAMGDLEQHLDLLIGLDKRAAQNVIVAVLAERRVNALHNVQPKRA